MALQWYYKVMGQEAGPVSSSELRELATSGFLTPDVEVRKGTEGDWTEAGRIRGLFEGPAGAIDEEADGPGAPAPSAPEPARANDRKGPVAEPRPSQPSTSEPPSSPAETAEVAWYCRAKGREIGPLSLPALKELAAAGFVTADVLVRKGDDGDWVPASEVASLGDAKPPTAPAGRKVEKSPPPARKAPVRESVAPKPTAHQAPAPGSQTPASEATTRRAPTPPSSARKPQARKPPARKAPAQDASAPSPSRSSGVDIPDDDGLFALVKDRVDEPPSPAPPAEVPWYYQTMGEVLGPVSWAELKELTEAGFVTPDVLVRPGADGPWVPASRAKGLLDGGPAPAKMEEPRADSEPDPLGLAPLPEDALRRPTRQRPREPAPQSPASETGWYCEVEGRVQGPLTAAELKERATSGRLAPGHRVRKGEDGPWIPASQVKGLLPKDASSATPRAPAEPRRPAAQAGASGSRRCPSCGREYKVWGEMATKAMKCTCGELLRPPAQSPAQPAAPSSGGLFDGPCDELIPVDTPAPAPSGAYLGSPLDDALDEPHPQVGAPGALPPRARKAAVSRHGVGPFGGEPSAHRRRGRPGMVSRVIVGGFMTFSGAVGAIIVLGIVVLVAIGLLFGSSQIAGALGQATREGGALFWISAFIYVGLVAMTGFAAYMYLSGGIGILRGESEGAEKGVAASTMILTAVGIDLVWSIILAVVVAQRAGTPSEKLGAIIGATVFIAFVRSIMPAALLFWCSKYGPRLPH